MKKVVYILVFLIVSLSLVNCSKEEVVAPEDITNWEIEILQNDAEDTLYYINKININSTNDILINNAKIKLTDQSGSIIFFDDWRNLKEFSFSLEERKEYLISAKLIDNETAIDEKVIEIDNRRYPNFVQILNISTNINLMTDVSGLENNFKNQIVIVSEGANEEIVYLLSFEIEDIVSYDIDSVLLPCTDKYHNYSIPSYSNNYTSEPYKWSEYIISIGYAKGTEDQFDEYIRLENDFKISECIKANQDPNQIYYNTDDFTIVTYKVVYK